jgi:RNA polymerase sigma factor (sigma-70 family)
VYKTGLAWVIVSRGKALPAKEGVMATCQLSPVIDQLRRSTLIRDGAGLTDGQLLSRFIERRDEAAFEALVRRHGPMVLGVGRRLLRNHHDAEDTLQATFLVLVRRAASIAPPEKLANWLYGVAYRTALKAKATNIKRAVKERQVMSQPDSPAPADPWRELLPLLDQELSRLPDKYRLPIVLCDLEGQSIKDAARNLDWPQGTLAGRLARARALLAKRVARHGLVLSVGTLTALLSQHIASASVPSSLILSTVRVAGLGVAAPAAAGLVSVKVAALTKGVLKSMLLSKLKTATAVFLTLGVIGLGGGALSYSLVVGEEPKGKQESPPAASKAVDDDASKKNAAQSDKEKLQGTWTLVRLEAFGKVFGADKIREVGDLTIDGNHLRSYKPYSVVPKACVLTAVASNGFPCSMFHCRWHGTFELGESRKPKRIAITDTAPNGERWSYGIYSLDGDVLRICLCENGDQIPNDFNTEEIGLVCFTFHRETGNPTNAGAFQSTRNSQSREVEQKTAEADMEKLQGDWELVRLEANGQQVRGAKFADVGNLTIEGDHLFSLHREPSKSSWDGTFKLDPSKKPKRITIFDQGRNGEVELQGIYSVDQDELKLCLNEDGTDKTIPSEFKTTKGSPFIFVTFKRMNKEDPLMPKKAPSGAGEKRWKQYHVECTLVKVDPQGKDFGEDGKGKVLSSPSLVVRENEERRIHSGGSKVVHEDQQHMCLLEFGVLARFKVYEIGGAYYSAPTTGGSLHVEAHMEEIDIDQTGNKETQARGRFVRTIATPKLGESVKLVEKDDKGEPRHWLKIKVVKEETVTLGRGYTEPAQSK